MWRNQEEARNRTLCGSEHAPAADYQGANGMYYTGPVGRYGIALDGTEERSLLSSDMLENSSIIREFE